MDWSSIDQGIRDVILDASGVAADVHWMDAPQAYRGEIQIKLQPLSLVSLGRSERRYAQDDGQLRERVYSARLWRLQVHVETRDQGLASSAMSVADALTSGLRSTPALDALRDLDLGVAEVGSVRQMNYTDPHQRVRSVCVFELVLNAHSSFLGALYDYVDRIAGTGTIEGANTSPISVPFDVLG